MCWISRTSKAFLFFIICVVTLWYKAMLRSNFDELAGDGAQRPWQEIAAEKRQYEMAKIPKDWILPASVLDDGKSRRSIAGSFIESLLDKDTLTITSLDVPDIVNQTSSGSLTAVQVVTAFSKRAAYAHQLAHNLLEIGFDLALERAQELDNYFKEHKKPIGPLHGVPLTLKDQFHIKGLETTMAYVGWIGTFEGAKGTGKERVFESELIRELHGLGAIPIGKTSLVQSTWAPETNNNILGYAWNPHNQLLSAGGSSGGEGSMQALRGSAFGIGTDSGGSVSMPAAFNGVFSFKPSTGRIAFKGAAGSALGNLIIPAVAGILGHSVQSLGLVFKSLLSTEPWLHDPLVLPIPWRDMSESPPLSFGFMRDDSIVTPHPPIARALRIVEDALLAAGHNVIPWNGPSYNESIQIHGPIARGDGCPDVWKAIHLSGEPIVPQIENVFPGGKLKKPMNLVDYENVVLHLQRYRTDYQEYWRSTADKTSNGRPIGALISPVTPYAAVLPGKFLHSPYTSSCNVLDYPSVVIPVTFADKEIDKVSPDFKPHTDIDRKNMELYDPLAYDGGPAAIQLVGQNLEEEKLLHLAQIVVDALEKYEKDNKQKL